MDAAPPDPPLNPCHWEPEFYAAASTCAHGWAAYRGSGPPRPKPVRHCNFCGSTTHLMRGCTMGSSLAREHQFLRCATALPMPCFVRRFVVPLHRARADFDLDDLREGRILWPVDTDGRPRQRQHPLPQPWARALPRIVTTGPSPFKATRQPSKGPPKAADRRPNPLAGIDLAARLVVAALVCSP